ncbi:MAG TPA: ATP-binding cassette domain-containing protein [Nocardiopsis listeri]|uniref:ATP-binding cassette domain-containing protein n=1 Tax=Nocardiopsis listeri TaxID=53440 RepID=UPI001D8F7C16|nr:ATP-binding cassette domain-containing protein [Nocardiopsis listeri]HJE59326.1 ATP-binding cassette domain-containing protein [Nocardiopsis listeri]
MTRTTPRHLTESSTAAVKTRGLVKNFGSQRAVDGIDLDVSPGEIFGILGPNGAGKTTMLRMLSTLLRIDEGSAEIFGVDVAAYPHKIRQLIGVTGQDAAVDEGLTARENLLLFSRLQGLSRARAQKVSGELLEEFGLGAAADKTLAKFSGGMRRRLDLATSLITRPPLIFLDEPTTGLDPRTRNQMWLTIRSLVDEGATVLLTTQYLEEVDHLADRVAVIDHGRMVAQGTPEQLKASIGGSSLKLVLTDPGRTAAAREHATALMGADVVHVPQAGELLVALRQADEAAAILVALREAKIGVESMNVRQPSLDEVFLAITGQSVTDTTSTHTEVSV